eukprot:TRINITY_DN26123_c0_g1_i1.p1 TRINITY_DN26123_c0_g1~~TRINITY_DN26123_c0_g1_i1.p1  ORF type:complete len:320 (-),score=36.85 TRINITY_DN26123_c0_g1_i1:57-1016(-)
MNSLSLFAHADNDDFDQHPAAARPSQQSPLSSSAAWTIDATEEGILPAPGQQSLSEGGGGRGMSSAVAAVAAAARTAAGQPAPTIADAISGPHLRTVVVAVSVSVWLWGRGYSWWTTQCCMPPLFFALTVATSAVWCTPKELVISLGPIPVCIFRRRFPYQDIRSVTVVRSGISTLNTVLRKGARPWRVHSYIYALTIGKAVIDIALEPESPSYKALGNFGGSLLISVDEAHNIAELVLFRKQHGVDAPLPAALAALKPTFAQVTGTRWVWFDVCDVLFRPWRGQDKVLCNVWDLLLQPWRQPTVHPMWRPNHHHARTA